MAALPRAPAARGTLAIHPARLYFVTATSVADPASAAPAGAAPAVATSPAPTIALSTVPPVPIHQSSVALATQALLSDLVAAAQPETASAHGLATAAADRHAAAAAQAAGVSYRCLLITQRRLRVPHALAAHSY